MLYENRWTLTGTISHPNLIYGVVDIDEAFIYENVNEDTLVQHVLTTAASELNLSNEPRLRFWLVWGDVHQIPSAELFIPSVGRIYIRSRRKKGWIISLTATRPRTLDSMFASSILHSRTSSEDILELKRFPLRTL
jgi:hypothetical protein